jgi:hypothetical protein
LLIISTIAIAFSCTPEEGPGGKTTIKGNIQTQYYCKADNSLVETKNTADEDVYIVYGNDQSYGDKTKTAYNGNFEFKYYEPGNYSVYFYSDSLVGEGYEKNAVKITSFKVSKGKSSYTIDTLYQKKWIDVDDGSATIRAQFFLINYKDNFTAIKDTAAAQEQDIYLCYGNSKMFSIRERASYDGTVEFKNLIKGKYKVFAYQDNYTGATELLVKSKDVVITENGQVIDLGKIYLIKK